MTEKALIEFEDVKTVVRDPLRFKYKLDIGEDAYQSLRLKKYLLDAVDAGNGALVGFGAAKSSLVASTFFAPSGFLGALGVTSAATPVGWAIAAGVVGAGLSLAIGKHLVRGSSSSVRSIPDCINTPMDVLAVGLFDLIATLAMKVAQSDQPIDERERVRIRQYFVDEWGFDEAFVEAGLIEVEKSLDQHSLRDIAEQLAQFKKQNPDCQYSTMSREIVEFLHDLSAVDGRVHVNELAAIAEVESVFEDVNRVKVGVLLGDSLDTATQASKRAVEEVGAVASTAASAAVKVATESASVATKAAANASTAATTLASSIADSAATKTLGSLAKRAGESVKETIERTRPDKPSDKQ